jgi:hypothetical protein
MSGGRQGRRVWRLQEFPIRRNSTLLAAAMATQSAAAQLSAAMSTHGHPDHNGHKSGTICGLIGRRSISLTLLTCFAVHSSQF